MQVYTSLLIISIIVLLIVLFNIIKNKMKIAYAMVWILWGMAMILISLFPNIIFKVGKLIGIKIPSNTVFLLTIFLLYCLTFYVYLKISKHNEDIVNLNYEIANLKKKIEELNEKNK